jgi:hypothetical protein
MEISGYGTKDGAQSKEACSGLLYRRELDLILFLIPMATLLFVTPNTLASHASCADVWSSTSSSRE